MTHFETFTKQLAARRRAPVVTIYRGMTVAMNAAAHALIGSPRFVELVLDRDTDTLRVRPASGDGGTGMPVRTPKGSRTGPFKLSAIRFFRTHGFAVGGTVRRLATLDAGTLKIVLAVPAATAAPHRPRPIASR